MPAFMTIRACIRDMCPWSQTSRCDDGDERSPLLNSCPSSSSLLYLDKALKYEYSIFDFLRCVNSLYLKFALISLFLATCYT